MMIKKYLLILPGVPSTSCTSFLDANATNGIYLISTEYDIANTIAYQIKRTIFARLEYFSQRYISVDF